MRFTPLDKKKSAPSLRRGRHLVDMTTATPMEQLAARSYEHVQFIHNHFFRRLSRDDCADAVQDAFLQASASADCAELELPQLDAWIKRAAYNKAIDILRGPERDGRGAVRRHRTDIDALAEVLAADDTGTPGTGEDVDDTAEAVRDAFLRLPVLDQRVIGLRHHDNLPREACAELLGMPVTKYKRAHTRAVQRLINLVVQTSPFDSCAPTRSLINLSSNGLLDDDNAARRDAHVAGCAHCRQYERHSRGLLVLSPLPAIGVADRLFARLHTVAERFSLFASSAPEAATAASGAGTLGAGAAKVAAVLASGAVAVGGAGAVVHHSTTPKSKTETVAAPGKRSHAAATPATYAARPQAGAASASTAHASPSAASAQSSRRSTSVSSAKASTSAELKPPGHEAGSATAGTATVPPQTRGAPRIPTSTTATKSPPTVEALTSTPPDSSSGEFAPHP